MNTQNVNKTQEQIQDIYIIRREATIRQASATTHYIVKEDGKIAFRLNGSKREQVIFNPRQRKLRYHVRIYRSNRGRKYVTVTDIYENKVVVDWFEGLGIEPLLDAINRYPWLLNVLKRENVLGVIE